jgi:transcriptional regulator with XRE-family HTH domain
MATRQRPVDRGTERALELVARTGRELRAARRGAGLGLVGVGRAVAMSASAISRIERGLVREVSLYDLARIAAVVGLELTARTFPAGEPIRDRGHVRLLDRLRQRVHASLIWRMEVPMPRLGDLRAWDATISGRRNVWVYGVEAETNPHDGQAIVRRIQLKFRDGGVDGVILLLPDTRQSRAFRREFGPLLEGDFPVAGSVALKRLAAGLDPGGNAVLVL